MARPLKLTKDVQDRLCDLIRLGITYEVASQASGITYRTFANWVDRGRKAQSGLFFQFFHAVELAKAESQVKLCALIHKAAQGGGVTVETRVTERGDGSTERVTIEKTAGVDWRAALAILERRFPETWAKRDKVEIEMDWKAELEKKGVNVDEIIEQTSELIRKNRW